MKLTIKHEYDPRFEDSWWQCELENDKALWLGVGDSPIEAFQDYLNLVISEDQPNKGHFDYDWCQQKGLI